MKLYSIVLVCLLMVSLNANAGIEGLLKAFFEKGKCNRVVAEANRFIRDNPDDDDKADAYYYMGRCYTKNKDYSVANEYLALVLGQFPDYSRRVEIIIMAAENYFRLGMFENSQEALTSLDIDKIENKKTRFKTLFLLALVTYGMATYYDTAHWAFKSLKLAKDPERKKRLEDMLKDILSYRLTVMELEKLDEDFGNEKIMAYAIFKLAQVFYQTGNYKKAVEYLERFQRDYSGSELEASAKSLAARINNRNVVFRNTIGVVLPLTGDFAYYGKRSLMGLQLAAGIFNKKKEKTGEFIQLVIYDDEGDVKKAEDAVEKLVFEDHAIAVIGSLHSRCAEAVARKSQELGIPNITLSIKKNLTDIGDYVFRNILTPEHQTEALVNYAMGKLQYKRFAILFPNHRYGREMAYNFWDAVERRGGKITGVESYKPGQTDFKVEVKNIVGLNDIEARNGEIAALMRLELLKTGRQVSAKEFELPPIVDFDAVFIPDGYKAVGQILPAFAFFDVENVKFLGTNTWNTPKIVERCGDYIEGGVFVDAFFKDVNDPVVSEFLSHFNDVFSEVSTSDPDMYVAQSYDALKIIQKALSTGSSETRAEFRDKLMDIQGYKGVTGIISFTDSGEAQRSYKMLTVKRSVIQPLEEK